MESTERSVQKMIFLGYVQSVPFTDSKALKKNMI